jgi:hypothetical protein
MRALVGLLTWLAIKAGADIGREASLVGSASRVAKLGPAVHPDRAGRLVPIAEKALEPTRPVLAHWALLAAVALVVLIVAGGYLRRRWRAHAGGRGRGLRGPRRDVARSARAELRSGALKASRLKDESRDAFDVVELEHRQCVAFDRMIGGDGDDALIARREPFARRGRPPPDLDLRNGRTLISLDENEIGWTEALRKLFEGRRRCVPYLAGELPLRRRDHRGLIGACTRVALAVG